MTEGGGATPEPPEDQGNRQGNSNVENVVMLGFLVVLVAAGIWLLGPMADIRKVQDCAASAYSAKVDTGFANRIRAS
jgi:hypothetical protein